MLTVPENPIIPFIEGDVGGKDYWKASRRVLIGGGKEDGGKRRVVWFGLLREEKAFIYSLFKQLDAGCDG